MIRLSLLFLFTLGTFTLSAQSIKNVDFYVDGEEIVITYDIVNAQNGQQFDISVYKTHKDAQFQSFSNTPLKAVSGDVGKNIKGGYGKRIRWRVLEEMNSLEGEIAFEVQAKVQGGNPNMPEMVRVEGGRFMMGSNGGEDDERPVHRVNVSTFYIGKYEVTNAQYAAFLNTKGNQREGGKTWLNIGNSQCQIKYTNGKYRVKNGFENYPVIYVSWYGARAYCKWVGGRLPSEAEWEYAAQGGNRSQGYQYAGGNNVSSLAWYRQNSQNTRNNLYVGRGSHQVGLKQTNELGLYDMTGNVWEWCEDTWHSGYINAPTNGRAWLGGNNMRRVSRGGSWNVSSSSCRITYRSWEYANDCYRATGFRVAKD